MEKKKRKFSDRHPYITSAGFCTSISGISFTFVFGVIYLIDKIADSSKRESKKD